MKEMSVGGQAVIEGLHMTFSAFEIITS